jgi:uncharacterized protein (TIGR02118 family)
MEMESGGSASLLLFLLVTETYAGDERLFFQGGNNMIQLTVLYGHPKDPTAFDRHYQGAHASLVKRVPGLKGYTSTKPTSLAPQEQSPYYLIAALFFENMGTFQVALQSPEGQAMAGDLPNFATGGATPVVGEVEVYGSVSIS